MGSSPPPSTPAWTTRGSSRGWTTPPAPRRSCCTSSGPPSPPRPSTSSSSTRRARSPRARRTAPASGVRRSPRSSPPAPGGSASGRQEPQPRRGDQPLLEGAPVPAVVLDEVEPVDQRAHQDQPPAALQRRRRLRGGRRVEALALVDHADPADGVVDGDVHLVLLVLAGVLHHVRARLGEREHVLLDAVLDDA